MGKSTAHGFPGVKIFREPLKAISQNRLHFLAWLVVGVGLGLTGFWVRLFVLVITNASGLCVPNLLDVRTLGPFVIVILADGIAAMLGAVKAGSNPAAAAIRKAVGSVALLIVILQIIVFSIAEYDNVKTLEVPGSPGAWAQATIQLAFVIFASLLACYLYCFRFLSWEDDVANVMASEASEVDALGKNASLRKRDHKGVKL